MGSTSRFSPDNTSALFFSCPSGKFWWIRLLFVRFIKLSISFHCFPFIAKADLPIHALAKGPEENFIRDTAVVTRCDMFVLPEFLIAFQGLFSLNFGEKIQCTFDIVSLFEEKILMGHVWHNSSWAGRRHGCLEWSSGFPLDKTIIDLEQK